MMMKTMTVTVNEREDEDWGLPQEILVDILLRLPKSLVKTGRDESKLWSDLLGNDSFLVKQHWERANRNPGVIALNRETTKFYYAEDYRSYETATEVKIADDNSISYVVSGICDGLVCLTERYTDIDPCFIKNEITFESYSKSRSNVWLWNPITTEKKIIECVNYYQYNKFKAIFGFGCPKGTSDYKVIRILFDPAHLSGISFRSSAYVYSAESWRNLTTIPKGVDDIITCDPQVVVNDSLHWLAVGWVEARRVNKILSFDMKEETFRVFKIPFSCVRSHNPPPSLHVKELGGELCVFDNPIGGVLQVWVMKEYGVYDSWINLFRIGGNSTQLQPLGVTSNGDVILKKNVPNYQQLMLYNVGTKEVKKFKGVKHNTYNLAYAFTPTLITMNEYCEQVAEVDEDKDVEEHYQHCTEGEQEDDHYNLAFGFKPTRGTPKFGLCI